MGIKLTDEEISRLVGIPEWPLGTNLHYTDSLIRIVANAATDKAVGESVPLVKKLLEELKKELPDFQLAGKEYGSEYDFGLAEKQREIIRRLEQTLGVKHDLR